MITPENQEKTQHTPGPWEVHHRHPDPLTRLGHAEITSAGGHGYLGEGYTVAIADMYCMDDDAQKANARLIAAAPALLAALEKAQWSLTAFVGGVPFGPVDEAVLNEARAAIAAAKAP